MPTWSASSAARSPTRTWSPRRGRPRREVRPCISCNQLCWGRRSRDYWISCLVNPSAGRELEWGGDRFEPAADAPARPGRRRRTGRAGGGPGRGGAGPRVTLLERGRSSRRPVPARRPPAVARPDHGPARLVRPAAGCARRGRPARRRGRSPRTWPRARRTKSSWRPARARRGRVSSGPSRWSTGSPGWTARTSSRSRTCWTAAAAPGQARRSCSTTSATGAASGRPSFLAEAGHDVTIVTAAAVVAGGLFHSAADGPLRTRYAERRRPIDHVGLRPRAGGTGIATIRSTLTGDRSRRSRRMRSSSPRPRSPRPRLGDGPGRARRAVPRHRRRGRAPPGQPRLLRGPGAGPPALTRRGAYDGAARIPRPARHPRRRG